MAMFKLTKQEQCIVAALMCALLLGMAVKQWRARHPKPVAEKTVETRIR
jgi:hypothetical protein